MLIDTHSHLYDEAFDADRDEAIARAVSAGVGCILLPAIDRESYERQERLAAAHPNLFRQMMGLHPTSVKGDYESDLAIAQKRLFQNPEKYIGVGEIGLDFYWDITWREEQLAALEQQIGWAETLHKPVSLHLRSGQDGKPENDAYKTVFQLLEQHGSACYSGVMHCFSGSLDDALRAVEMGFALGIGGVVTYKKSTLPEIVRTVGLEHLVLETDAPYLAPVPHRGQRNESAYLSDIAQRIAEIKDIDYKEVAATTTQNAQMLFSL